MLIRALLATFICQFLPNNRNNFKGSWKGGANVATPFLPYLHLIPCYTLLMSQHASDDLQTKARRELWSFAFFRLESALVIGATIVLTGLSLLGAPWLPGSWPLWLGVGIVAEGALIASTVSDKALYRRLLDKLFVNQFDLKRLESDGLRGKVKQALSYHAQILEAVERKNSSFDDSLYRIVQDLERWVAQVYELALNLDVYAHDPVLAKDFQSVPKDLKALKEKLLFESSERVQTQLQSSYDAKTKQWQALQSLRDSMEGASLQLDNTLAAMSTLYTQTINLNAKELDTNQTQDLQREMRQQVQALEDMTNAMDDVYKLSSSNSS